MRDSIKHLIRNEGGRTMTIQQLINALQDAITVHNFDPESPVQIDMVCESDQMEDTYWNISVDASAISEPRSVSITIDDEGVY